MLEAPANTLSRWHVALSALLLAVGTFFVFFCTEAGEFLLLDDNEYVTENRAVLAGLNWNSIRWAFTQFHSGHWHPLTWISLMFDVEFFGVDPFALRTVNIIIHSLAIGFLFVALCLYSRRP
jgi:hypothetical protein